MEFNNVTHKLLFRWNQSHGSFHVYLPHASSMITRLHLNLLMC